MKTIEILDTGSSRSSLTLANHSQQKSTSSYDASNQYLPNDELETTSDSTQLRLDELLKTKVYNKFKPINDDGVDTSTYSVGDKARLIKATQIDQFNEYPREILLTCSLNV